MKRTKAVRSLASGACLALVVLHHISLAADKAEPDTYQPPTRAELQQAEALFRDLFAGNYRDSNKDTASALGFLWGDDESAISLSGHEQGWGEYHFAKTGSSDIALQAPHRFNDKYTGAIAIRLFRQHGFPALALNSVSRRTAVARDETLQADMARLPDSLHSIFSRAFASRYPEGQLVQLHGFDAKKRASPEARQADIILSTGGPWSSKYLLNMQGCLNDNAWNTLRFPQEVRELGATRNSIGALLRNLGHGGFVHIELNLETRKQLINDENQLQTFATCLLEAAK